jgi:hypothetical protein
MYAVGGACGLNIILKMATIIVARRIAPFEGLNQAIRQMHTIAELPTTNPEMGIRKP